MNTQPELLQPNTLQRKDQLSSRNCVGRLTRREQEVLCLLLARYTDREIADTLFISYRTATTHVARVREKLGIRSRREASAFAALADIEFR